MCRNQEQIQNPCSLLAYAEVLSHLPVVKSGMKVGARDLHADSRDCCVCSVIFLRSALGKLAVKQPAINVGSAFQVAADAALGAMLKPGFSPYKVTGGLAVHRRPACRAPACRRGGHAPGIALHSGGRPSVLPRHGMS